MSDSEMRVVTHAEVLNWLEREIEEVRAGKPCSGVRKSIIMHPTTWHTLCEYLLGEEAKCPDKMMIELIEELKVESR